MKAEPSAMVFVFIAVFLELQTLPTLEQVRQKCHTKELGTWKSVVDEVYIMILF